MPEVYQEIYYHSTNQTRQLGELNPKSIMTKEDVEKIRILYEISSRQSIFELFPQYKERTITSIISGQNWKHIPLYHKKEKRWTYPENMTEKEINEFNNKRKEILKEYEQL